MSKLATPSLQFEIGTNLYVERQLYNQSWKGTARIIGAQEPCYLLTDMPMSDGAPMISTVGEIVIVRFLYRGKMFGFKAGVLKITLQPFPVIVLKCPEHVEEMALRKHERLECRLPSVMKLEPMELDPDEADTVLVKGGNDKGEGKAQKPVMPPVPPPTPPALHTSIINLAEGGCQQVFLIHRPRDYSQEALEFQELVRPSHYAHYTAEALKASCLENRKATLGFQLPEPMSFKFPGIPCDIRWYQIVDMHFQIGVRFLDPDENTLERIRSIIAYQKKYFSPQSPWS